METLILEDFRCFAGRNTVPMRPLTLLVGENSTGKTSFLAAVRAAHDILFSTTPDFNEEPFNLGSYDQIANYYTNAGRAKSFAIGQDDMATSPRSNRSRARPPREGMRLEARFRSSKSQPTITWLFVSSEGYHIYLDLTDTGPRLVLSRSGEDLLSSKIDEHPLSVRTGYDLRFVLSRAMQDMREMKDPLLSPDDWERFDLLNESVAYYSIRPRVRAFAPIRTRPRRTYDPITEVRDPEGGHIPMMLHRLLGTGGGQEFRQRLDAFGEASGLYSSLQVRKLGQTDSDPFQLQVKVGAWIRNLADVGYGVSQAIPIIADCVSSEPEATLLIQQPEVHIHPRAQAEMGSFFAEIAASGRNQLVVETSSDHLLDRVRIDVQGEKIDCGDVMILYFEPTSHGVNIHPIELDSAGNLVGVPDGYRRFFLEEQRRFLGID